MASITNKDRLAKARLGRESNSGRQQSTAHRGRPRAETATATSDEVRLPIPVHEDDSYANMGR